MIPPQGRKAVLQELHDGHPGMTRMKALARMFVWWPEIDKDTENSVVSCPNCKENQSTPQAYPTNSATSTVVIELLRTSFARFGIPETIVTDNGPCFVSEEIEMYFQMNGIKHITSAPYHPASNGLAERAVQVLKKGLKKLP